MVWVWNSDIARTIVPDIVGIHLSVTLVPTIGGSYSYNIDYLTRGKDVGLHTSPTLTGRVGLATASVTAGVLEVAEVFLTQ